MGAKSAQHQGLNRMTSMLMAFLLFHPLRGAIVAAYVAASSVAADTLGGSSTTTIAVAFLTTVTGLGTAFITTRWGRSKAETKPDAAPPPPTPVSSAWSQEGVNALIRENLEQRARILDLERLLPPPPPPPPAPTPTTTRRRGSARGHR